MTLISSISGIRGTIGGESGHNLTPEDIVRFTKAFAQFIRSSSKDPQPTVIIGRDSRVSGPMVESVITGTLSAMGIHSILLGLTTTPTVEMAVTGLNADGGIIITASHNPSHWNALKLLNNKGEFLNKEEGQQLEVFMKDSKVVWADYTKLGTIEHRSNYIKEHIDFILALPLVDKAAITSARFRVVADAINSAGAVSLQPLLSALGVEEVTILNAEPTGIFVHNPEPLPEHLTQLCEAVITHKADIGIAVDPDVDRLALIMENGKLFGEEYTLVAVADYILSNTPGNTVSNLSSTRALQIVTEKHGQSYNSSAVGEVNVVQKMKDTQAVIGGEGNGGVIYPELHYGRDALVGIALILTQLAKSKKTLSELRATYPDFYIAKNKISTEGFDTDFDRIKGIIKMKYPQCQHDETDGLKMTFPDGNWVHLRTSNTEPIIRIYSESVDKQQAEQLAQAVMTSIEETLQ
jgi:phosphomannomutase